MRNIFFLLAFLTGLSMYSQSRGELAGNLYIEAQQAYRSGSFEVALKKVEESLLYEKSADSYYLNGLIFEALGKGLRAVASYEAVLKIEPEYYEARFQKALLYLEHGDADQALNDFDILITHNDFQQTRGIYFQIDPLGNNQNQVSSLVTLKSRLYAYRGQCYEKLGDYERALQDYNMAISKDSIADHFVNRGLLFSKSKKLDEALADLQDATRIEPQHQLAWYNLAILEPSVVLPDNLISDSSFAPILGLLASRALEEERYFQALKYLDHAVKSNGEDVLALTNRGRTLLKLKRFKEARADFQRAKKLEPTRAETLYLIGNTYFFEKEMEAAIAYYHQYLTLDPLNAMVWYNTAMSYLELDQYREGCNALNKAKQLGMDQAAAFIGKYCQ